MMKKKSPISQKLEKILIKESYLTQMITQPVPLEPQMILNCPRK
jgi:hypothetical protein